jgi:hypothetical protein
VERQKQEKEEKEMLLLIERFNKFHIAPNYPQAFPSIPKK